MKWIRGLVAGAAVLLLAAGGVYLGLLYFNDYKKDGELEISGLSAPVTVKRDEKQMAYVYAENLPDALKAQGFVTAQDRLFSMHLARLVAQGRVCELAGAEARALDIKMRTIGLHRIAKKQAQFLDNKTRRFFEAYVAGINAFIEKTPKDVHLAFRLAGIEPEPWNVADSLSILYYMAWSTSANLSTEITALGLLEAVGPDRIRQVLPVNINPDDPEDDGDFDYQVPRNLLIYRQAAVGGPACRGESLQPRRLDLGSNNWAVSPVLSGGSGAILAGDPHLDPRLLPGVWYPLGIITPEIRSVGVNIPGLPGMAMGRTQHVSLAMTNNYGDMQDLYVETVDPDNPDHYMEGGDSVPFESITEILHIKDKDAPGNMREEKIDIRRTRRGPVVSGVFSGLDSDRVITLRWAPAETMSSEIGLADVITAQSAADLHDAVSRIPMLCLNWVFADSRGNIGYRASGKIPVREDNDGTFPRKVTDDRDNWVGWISQNQMPHSSNPEKNWLGTCNHKTVAADYPFYYSSFFAPSYRYERLKELMAGPGPKDADAHWQYQRDTFNSMAEKIAPVMARALLAGDETRKMGQILADWDFFDDADQAAPAVFQSVYIRFARLVFEDELGSETAQRMLNNWYFWQERLQQMVLSGRSPWFDNKKTPEKTETMAELFRQAAVQARDALQDALGTDMDQWQWGEIHTLELVHPVRRQGLGKTLLGTGPMPMPGSGETLCRGWYDYQNPFEVTHCASLRMVVDMADADKVAAVLPGGVTGRLLSPHQKDQVDAFMNGRKLYWWFSDSAISENTQHTLVLR